MEKRRADYANSTRNQSPSTSRVKRAAATAAKARLRAMLSPEKSQEEKEKNTLSRALKRKVMPEHQKAEISRKDADSQRKKANQR